MINKLTLIAALLYFSSAAWTQKTEEAVEYSKSAQAVKESSRQLNAANAQLEATNIEITKDLAQIKAIDVQRWAQAFLNKTSVIKPEEAEKKFGNPQN